MQRQIQSKLENWKNSPRRKPLILQGARQVGKTFALKEFGKKNFKKTVYLNFEEDPELANLFDGKISSKKIIEQIELYLNIKIDSQTFLIFDEIQMCEKALTSLKYFTESSENLFIAAAGSLLGIQLNHSKSFPVGKVNFLHMYPMSFNEFLLAMQEDKISQLISKTSQKIEAGPVHKKLIDYLKHYYLIGGMPEAVASYIQNKDFSDVRLIHNEILKSYELDFAKYSNATNSLKISAIWKSLPQQLVRENKKFKLSEIKSSARYREYEIALRWLLDAGLVLQSRWVSTIKSPIDAYADDSTFKLFLLDTGLLASSYNLHPKTIMEESEIFQEAKGALVENFVAQEITALELGPLLYWSNEHRAQIDFLINHKDEIIPIEVKSGYSSHKKSLLIYKEKYKPKKMIRFSPMPYIQQDELVNISLYDCSRVLRLISP